MDTIAPTTSEPWWDADGPFGRPDGVHRLLMFTANETCMFNEMGVMLYYWTVPRDLDSKPTYRLLMRTSESDVEHYSGSFRLKGGCTHGRHAVGVGGSCSSRLGAVGCNPGWGDLLLVLLIFSCCTGIFMIDGFLRLRRRRRYERVVLVEKETPEAAIRDVVA